MKQLVQIIFFICLCRESTYAQETIYLANGNRTAGKLTGVDNEKIKITVNRNGKQSNYALRRENVLLAFTDDGRYLLIGSLDANPAKAQEQIGLFQQSPPPRLAYDLLVRAAPPLVIQGTISYESDEVVNYKTVSGASASINKRELAAILYRSGQHNLFMPPASVVTVLNSVKGELIRLSSPAPTPVAAQKATKITATKKTAKPVVSRPGTAVVVASPPVPIAIPAANTSVSESNRQAPTVDKPSLNDTQYQQYRASALQRVDEFVNYLNVIIDKSLDDDRKDKAIEQAVALFMPGATIEVTSSKRPGVKKLSIETYLNNLKMLVYDSASIEWNEIQYVSELTQAVDGNYYGVITGQQTFTGYAENGKDVLYSDVTQKSVKVKLQSYRKSSNKGAELKWAVLLGNIGVVTK